MCNAVHLISSQIMRKSNVHTAVGVTTFTLAPTVDTNVAPGPNARLLVSNQSRLPLHIMLSAAILDCIDTGVDMTSKEGS